MVRGTYSSLVCIKKVTVTHIRLINVKLTLKLQRLLVTNS